MSVTGLAVAWSGVTTGNQFVFVAGLGMLAIGSGLNAWDWLTSPNEMLDKVKEQKKELQDIIDEANKETEKLKGTYCP